MVVPNRAAQVKGTFIIQYDKMEDTQSNYYIRSKISEFNVTHLITFLWSGDLNCYTASDASTEDGEDWTRISLVYGEDQNQWVEIFRLQAHPQILQIQSNLRFLAAWTASFVANRTFGTVAKQSTGGWRNPKMLRKDMGEFDVEVAARHYFFLFDDAEQPAYARAHRYSKYHRRELFASDICGCFYCTATFTAQEIKDWIHEWDGVGLTALCPKCGINSVLGSASGYSITGELLQQMRAYWFSTATPESMQEKQNHGFLLL